MRTLFTLSIIITILSFQACQSTSKPANTITVSIIPQQYFVHQIAGDTLAVNVMVPPGGSPSTYEPTPQQMKALSHSAIYISTGHLGFEKAWMDKLASVNPKMKIIDTSKGLKLMADEAFEDDHGHDHHHNHSHEGYNPHIWLSPALVKQQAQTIFETLSTLYPDKEEAMQANLNNFILQCDTLSSDLQSYFEPLKGQSFIVYHPVWTYLASDLGLKQISIEHNGKEATADKLKRIIDFAKENDIHSLFVQEEFSKTQAQTIAKEIDGQVIPLNPLAYDWFNTMYSFKEAFEKKQLPN